MSTFQCTQATELTMVQEYNGELEMTEFKSGFNESDQMPSVCGFYLFIFGKGRLVFLFQFTLCASHVTTFFKKLGL